VKWAKVFPAIVAVSSVLIIIALTPAAMMDPLVTAVAQIRQNAARPAPTPLQEISEMESPAETRAVKAKQK